MTNNNRRINININALETVACPKCNNLVFKTNLSIFKKLLGIQSPSGRAQLIQINLVSCPACNSFFQVKDDKLLPVIFQELNKTELEKNEA